jgi:hypothetical protein
MYFVSTAEPRMQRCKPRRAPKLDDAARRHGPGLTVHSDEIDAVDMSAPECAERACAAFLRTGAAWELQVDEASRLLGLSEVDYALWIEAPALTPAILIRLSYLFGIYVDLTRLLPAPGRAARWVRQPNTAAVFGGRTALEYLLERDVAQWAAVRNYLSGQFG